MRTGLDVCQQTYCHAEEDVLLIVADLCYVGFPMASIYNPTAHCLLPYDSMACGLDSSLRIHMLTRDLRASSMANRRCRSLHGK